MVRPILAGLLIAASACSEPPMLREAHPPEAEPGDPLTLRGTGFGPKLTVSLRPHLDPQAEPRLLPVAALSETEATLDLPDDLTPGRWQLFTGDAPGDAPEVTVSVWTADTDPPCAKHYALDVTTLRTKRAILVERLFTDRPAEKLSWAGDELQHLSLGQHAGCTWLRLHTADGSNPLLYDAQEPPDQARRIATAIGEVLDLPVRDGTS